MPRLTIMMAAHNAEGTIATAISSALRSAPDDSELVVCDDGSTDRTAEVVDALTDRRIRILQHSTSRGSGAARQTVLDSTDSEFIANMDADDISLPWRFPRMLPAAEGHDAVFTGALVFGNGHWAKPSLTFPLSAQELPAILTIHNPLFHSSMLARRSAVESVGGYRSLRRAQDYDLWLRMAAGGARLRRLATPAVAYRLSRTQISGGADYLTLLGAQPELRSSYWKNLDLVLGRQSAAHSSSQGAPATIRQSVHGLVRGFRPTTRAYYRRVLCRTSVPVFPHPDSRQ
ncbi:Glycosyltransferase involved in cell wall bisynthesis [Austwickia chelonae]|uniref:Putative glycosyltransferase n=1 Tax=Austwickia chelonae NBRC 105200 TaxID=1184607 RepID=K6V9F9_9MICO|nr:glycosyltransferase family 2 protein [Austwickia chelonae]GAB78873.1 putative glycosyltransferase [Austwickia chelonae NBRC 105200]SEV85686.1 Glycosyltransferase involved in cell wall bisynthesis [Austwickia chelonae]